MKKKDVIILRIFFLMDQLHYIAMNVMNGTLNIILYIF